MTVSDLPTLNALLNASSGVLLLIGHRFIRNGNQHAHKRCMLSALGVSAAFLVSYLIYHYHHGATSFIGEGIVRPIYFSILISHTVLAITVVPLALITLSRGLKERFDKHVKIARWTYPIWLYVSVTGVVIYIMLYHLYPS
jgi:putative membrane protein